MTSTTDEVRICEHCGKPLEVQELPSFGSAKPLVLFVDCECEEARKAREEERKRDEAKQLEADKRDFYERLARAGVKKRYQKAEHELASKMTAKVLAGESLYIWGPFGTGKTHLASAIARKLVWAKKHVRMLTGIDLTMELQATYGSSASEADVMGRFARCPVLVIDDLGKEPPSDWVLSRLFSVINARYDAMLPVIITTNYERGKLVERMGKHGDHDTAEALVSRLCEMGETIPLSGNDRRLA